MDKIFEGDLCCPICYQVYSEIVVPHSLNCGHSVCRTCLNGLLTKSESNENRCGECRTIIRAKSYHDVSINYTVLRLLETLNTNEKNSELDTVNNKIDDLLKKLKEKKNSYNFQADNVHKMINEIEDEERKLLEMRRSLDKKHKTLKLTTSLSETFENVKDIMATIKDVDKHKAIIENRLQREMEIGRFQSLFDSPEDYYFTIHDKGRLQTSCFIRNGIMYIQSFPQLFVKPRKYELKINTFRPYIARTYIIITYNKDVSSMIEFELFDMEGTRAKHFLDACLGLKRNLRGVKFYDHERIEREGESISFGHVDDDKSANHLDKGCRQEEYIKTGYLTAATNTKKANHWKIYLEGWPSRGNKHCFGRVVRGLNIMKSVLRNKFDVKISESGLVLDFSVQ